MTFVLTLRLSTHQTLTHLQLTQLGSGLHRLGQGRKSDNPEIDWRIRVRPWLHRRQHRASGLIHWQSKSRSVVALSILEAEYIACTHATWESFWLKRMTKEVADGMSVLVSGGLVPIGCDNQGALKLIASGVVRQKSKYIDVKYHRVHDEQQRGSVRFQHVTWAANPADLLTKPLATPRVPDMSSF